MSSPSNILNDNVVPDMSSENQSRSSKFSGRGLNINMKSPNMQRPNHLVFNPKNNKDHEETDKKLKAIMQNSGKLKINGRTYVTDIKDMELVGELGSGTCGHVMKMRHKPSGELIAVKQMRRSTNNEDNKRIVMDIEVVIKSLDCQYIVQCLGCFITDTEVWICMELMATSFDKLLKHLNQPIPENIIGKITVATVKALAYLKEKHEVIHRDVKPSNILLDIKGNIKLCDFGISGLLEGSMAKTRSAGCAAYMAPERIEPPDPKNPDYDIRADVWALGITVVELGTGAYPYPGCLTDFEVLAKVIEQAPPSLPMDMDFSNEFRNFVSTCLRKDQRQRPKYATLQQHPFIKRYENLLVDVGQWYMNIMDAEEVAGSMLVDGGTARHTVSASNMTNNINATTINTTHLLFRPPQPLPPVPLLPPPSPPTLTNGNNSLKPQEPQRPNTNPFLTASSTATLQQLSATTATNGRGGRHASRFTAFQNELQHQQQLRYEHRSCSPYQAAMAAVEAATTGQQQPPHATVAQRYTQSIQERIAMSQRHYYPSQYFEQPQGLSGCQISSDIKAGSSPYPTRRYHSPAGSGSPLPLIRNHFGSEDCSGNGGSSRYNEGNTSPIVLQRFYHQKQQHQREAEEAAKVEGKKKISYIKLHLSCDRAGSSSRHQSPEPPPRLSRGIAGNESPLAARRNFFETAAQASPTLSRRYVSPAPPMPPPRKLSESNSVPGSPQHLRARFHYTPEPQRRVFRNAAPPAGGGDAAPCNDSMI